MVTHKSCVFPAESIYSENRGHEGWRPMTKLDGEQSPPFEVLEPAEWRAPLISNSPHSGSGYPYDFLTASRIDPPTPRRSEGSSMGDLISGLGSSGYPWVRVSFP